jgi:putative SOS response-associated peptidase YedK
MFQQDADAAADPVKHLVMRTMKWGVIPHWEKAEDSTLNTINARAESLMENSGMWTSIKGKKRCVVVAQGCVIDYLRAVCSSNPSAATMNG